MLATEKLRKRFFFTLLISYALTTAFVLFATDRASLIWQFYLSPLIFISFGLLLTSDGFRMDRSKWICMAFPVWYLVSRICNGQLYLYNGNAIISPFLQFLKLCVTFGLFLWMFSVFRPHVRDQMMHTVFIILILGCAILSVISLVSTLRPGGITLPVLGTQFYIAKSGRLYGGENESLTAIIAFVAMLLTLYVMVSFKRLYSTVIGCILLLLFYSVVALADSRTVRIACALSTAAAIMTVCLRSLPGAKVKRACLSLFLGVVCALLVYSGFRLVCNAQNALVSNPASVTQGFVSAAKAEEQAEAPAPAESPAPEPTLLPTATPRTQIVPRSFSFMLTNLTGRTGIYQNVVDYIVEHPRSFLIGVLEEKSISICGNTAAHNSWLQALFTTGIPGLLIVLYLTFLSWREAWKVFRNREPFPHVMLAIGILSLQIIGLMESILFFDLLGSCSPLVNLYYFLSLGYLLAAHQSGQPELSAAGADKP